MRNIKQILPIVTLVSIGLVNLQAVDEYTVTPEWRASIEKIAPSSAMAPTKKERTLLVFSLITGFNHKVTAQTAEVVKILGSKTGAWKVVASNDIEEFSPENIRKYDAVVLNNNCPTGKNRDIFRDVLINLIDKHGEKFKKMQLAEREALSAALLDSLMNYIKNGGGLIALHGAIANFNYNDQFSALIGGSFDFHPPSQEVTLYPVDNTHPLLQAFNGRPLIHQDEPYFFNRAYTDFNFRPLLELDVSKLKAHERVAKLPEMKRYAAWIKPHGKGRVFYSSPSHFPASFQNPALLQFMLGGIQYALGDLECDDSPLK
jgi:type 1 glutamine amidotransferase